MGCGGGRGPVTLGIVSDKVVKKVVNAFFSELLVLK